jgi:toxin ParE1/3/4
MARLTWAPAAVEDLESTCEFIGRRSEQYARVVAERIVALVESIPKLPRAGSIVPEYDQDDLRERLYHHYRIIYRLRGEDVEIVRICHGARPLPPTAPP